MWGKIVASAAGLLAFALAATLGYHLILAYGDARRSAGRAEAEAAQLPAIAAANAAAANAGLAARDAIIAADHGAAREMARLLPLIIAANDKVSAYAQTDDGRHTCLFADRVRSIEADRAALFANPFEAAADDPRSVPANTFEDAIGP